MSRRLRLALAGLAFLATSSHPWFCYWHPAGVAEQRLRASCPAQPPCDVSIPDWHSWPIAMGLPIGGGVAAAIAVGASLARRRLKGLAAGLEVLAGAQVGLGVAALAVFFSDDGARFPPLQVPWVLLHFAPAGLMQVPVVRAAWLGAAAVGAGGLFFTIWSKAGAC